MNELKHNDDVQTTSCQINHIVHDTETTLIGRGAVTPEWVCSGFGALKSDGSIETALISELTPGYREVHKATYSDPNNRIILHNTSFDLRVISKGDQEMMDIVWDALMGERVIDTLIREKLLNLTQCGDIDFPNGRAARYDLASVYKRYTGEDISESKKDGGVRTNYADVRHLPIEEWPEDFVHYAKVEDPTHTMVVYLHQEKRRQNIIDEIGVDPFRTQSFRVAYSFALALMTEQGLPVDKERLVETTRIFHDLYKDPRLVNPLVEAGILKPALPALPYAKGQKEHVLSCVKHKENPQYTAKKVQCSCPPKMKKPVKEGYSLSRLHGYIWALARVNPDVDAWISDATVKSLREAGILSDMTVEGKVVKQSVLDENETLPKGWKLKADKDWMEAFTKYDDFMKIFAERKKLEKMITSYLPRMYYEDDNGEKIPADTIHADFDCLKRTGRTSSRGTDLYPSWNGQQVDPRIRPCAVALPDHMLVSIDYNAMELVTLAQTAYNLFGYSILKDVINAGEDSHAFLGAQIAYSLDDCFKEMADEFRLKNNCEIHADNVWSDYRLFKMLKGNHDECVSNQFLEPYTKIWKKKGFKMSWDTFFKHYRTFAKPTGLGLPGGLGPKTFVEYAAATYKVEVDLETAKLLREIWKSTFPELKQYLDYISNEAFDEHHMPEEAESKDGKKYKRTFYAYDTPMGLHRARTDFCAAANGMGLQSPSAEGAGLAVIEIQRLCYTTNDTCLSRVGHDVSPVKMALFIHDEVLGQFKVDGQETERVELCQKIMKEKMELITPDVMAGTEPAAQLRWDKRAEPVYLDGNLIPWMPEEETKKLEG